MTTVLELLECAKINLVDNAGQGPIPQMMGAAQITAVIALLEKGYSADDDTSGIEWLDVDSIPEKNAYED